MSIHPIDRPKQTASPPASSGELPLLQSGDHLSRAEFERRYRANPEIKAELIEGVVYVLTYEQQVKWFVLGENGYELLEADKNGVLRSEIFPGLWLQPAALWTGDLATILAMLQQGLASPEHTTFLAQLEAKRQN